ncbi:MAG: hypothetical protein Q7U14_13895, partial [Lacisediminimonas sp.]|nr:hypothetical protein [Lacisediminimonas sp.]
VERLTLKGKGANYDASHIASLGGNIRFTAGNLVGDVATSYLGSTAFRGLGASIYQQSAMQAASVVMESVKTLNVAQDITALANGHVDLRTYGNNANLELNANLYSSASAAQGGDGGGWMRIQSADGALLNTGNKKIIGENAYVLIETKNGIGTLAKPLQTRIGELTVTTASHGSGNVTIIEDNDLVLREERSLVSPENPGYVIDGNPASDQWEATQAWDDSAPAAWKQVIAGTRSGIAVEVAQGDLSIDLVGVDSLLSLASGTLTTLKAGADITLTADDMDFSSGTSQLVGSGELSMQAHSNVWRYYLGTAAETNTGLDQEENSPLQTSQPAMYLSGRDLAALADGFTGLFIGRTALGNAMWLGDIKYAESVKFYPNVQRPANARESSFRDTATIKSDVMTVAGDVESPDDLLTLQARKLQVQSQNVQDPYGLPDSGVMAKDLVLQIGEQAIITGNLTGQDSLTINVTGTPSSDAWYVPPYGANSLQFDGGSLTSVLNDGSVLRIDTAAGIEIRGMISVDGDHARLDLDAGGALLVVEGADVRGLGQSVTLDLASADVVAVNPGSAIRAGVAFRTGDEGLEAYITGDDGVVNLRSSGEMLLGGSVSSSGSMALASGAQKYDNADYGDPLHADYQPRYAIFNKTAYFERIAAVSPDHYLVPHTGGYGMLVTGTVTSLGDGADLVLRSDQDVILRGNVNALGADSTLTLQSNEFLYVEGFTTATAGLNLYGGVGVDGAALGGSAAHADARGTSVYVHATSTVRTSDAGSSVTVGGGEDVDIMGVIVAGGAIGENGVLFNGEGASVTVSAGQQVRLESGLLASGDVSVNGGVAGSDDNGLGLLISTVGGITAAGLGAG